MAGMALGPAIAISGRDPSGRLWPWVLTTAVFLALFLHRLGASYVISGQSVVAMSWWGLGRPEMMLLADLASAEVFRGAAMGLAGCGHVHLRSARPDSAGLVILAQPGAEALAQELGELAKAARASGGAGEEGAPEGG
jgi:hypothetical protein